MSALLIAASPETAADFALWEQEMQPTSPVYEIPKLESDVHSRQQAARLIGQVAASTTCELSYGPETANGSLLDAIRKAREGDEEACKLVAMNVRTDVIERTIKAGHVMRVELGLTADGQITQYGQTAQAIQANSLKYASSRPQIRERTEAETRNMFRIQWALDHGLLEDYAVVVISRAADNMTIEDMKSEGFFVDTMSAAIQVTTLNGGKPFTESAFVAGKKHRNAERHDAEAAVRMGVGLGVDLAGKSASGVIDTALLVHKRRIPNGVIDCVRLWDWAVGGTFFGQDKPVQDYLAYAQECRRREAELESTVQIIVTELLASEPGLRLPPDATNKLGELSAAHLLKRAVTDEQIDGMVFGVESAYYLEAARYHYSRGDFDQGDLFLDKAIDADESSSCPGGVKQDQDCDFISQKCPLCGTAKVRTVVKKIAGNKKRISGSCHCSVVVTMRDE